MSKTIARIMVEKDDDLALKVMVDKGMEKDVYTKENLEVAASKGLVNATKFLSDSKGAAHITHDNKIDAMFVAAQAHQVETVKVLAEAGVSLTYAFGAVSDHESYKPFVEALLNPVTGMGYDPSDEDLHFLRLAGKTNVLTALDDRNRQHQDLYKEAFRTYISDPIIADDIADQKTLICAAATGTAAHIDHHVFNGEHVNNKGWLKNLDVALWHGNDETAQALIKHGAEVKPEYVNVARRYCKPDTVEALRTAQIEQLQTQAPTTEQKPHRPVKKATKTRGMSL